MNESPVPADTNLTQTQWDALTDAERDQWVTYLACMDDPPGEERGPDPMSEPPDLGGFRDERDVMRLRGLCPDCGTYKTDGKCLCNLPEVPEPADQDDEPTDPDVPF